MKFIFPDYLLLLYLTELGIAFNSMLFTRKLEV